MKLPITSSRVVSVIIVAGMLIAGGCAGTRTSDSTGQFVDDSAITAKVKKALLTDDSVRSFEITVTTFKGVVQLSGFVDTADQRAAAFRDASAVSGVIEVKDSLVLK